MSAFHEHEFEKSAYTIEKEGSMRANIIIHSISGNLYIVANTFKEKLIEKGIDAKLYRVEDPDLHLAANIRNDVNEYYEDIMELPVITSSKLLKGDVILVGTHAMFGMPTSEMKAFLDSTWPLYEKKELEGKLFYGFGSSSVSKTDGKNAVAGLYSWARMQNMEYIPYTSYIHKSGVLMPNRPSQEIDEIAYSLADAILNIAEN